MTGAIRVGDHPGRGIGGNRYLLGPCSLGDTAGIPPIVIAAKAQALYQFERARAAAAAERYAVRDQIAAMQAGRAHLALTLRTTVRFAARLHRRAAQRG